MQREHLLTALGKPLWDGEQLHCPQHHVPGAGRGGWDKNFGEWSQGLPAACGAANTALL